MLDVALTVLVYSLATLVLVCTLAIRTVTKEFKQRVFRDAVRKVL